MTATPGLVAALLGFLGLAVAGPSRAQRSPNLVRWQRVRVTAPAAGLVRNVFGMEDVTRDSVILVREPSPGRFDTVRLARRQIEVFEVSRHRGSHALAGALVGAAAGVVWGASWATHTSNPASSTAFEGTWGDNTGGILVRVLAGGLAGAVVGGLFKTETWVALRPRELRMEVTSLPVGRLRLGGRLTL